MTQPHTSASARTDTHGPFRIGIDFGGTKIEAAAIDQGGATLARLREPTPGDYPSALATVNELVAAIEAGLGRALSIGVGAPGSISPKSGLMRNANTTWLNGRAFQADLAQTLARPVRIANDANCLALSEAIDGAGAGVEVVFAVIIGTGCGGGLAVRQRLVPGASGVSGEWGHTPLPWAAPSEYPGPECWCGRRGCMETWVSGTGFQRDYAAATGDTASAETIISLVEAGDPGAAAALDRYIDRLGRGLAVICDILDPDVIVLGGGMSNVAALYARLPEIVRRHIFADAWDGRIAPARWGDSSGVRGAAWLWRDDLPGL